MRKKKTVLHGVQFKVVLLEIRNLLSEIVENLCADKIVLIILLYWFYKTYLSLLLYRLDKKKEKSKLNVEGSCQVLTLNVLAINHTQGF